VAPKDDNGNLITVRFVNTVGGRDVVVQVEPGSNLLAVGDNNGVALPRACRTGLCGSCTCEVQDPEAIKTATNPRDGFATIRACSTKCFVPEGMNEMVVDVYRMRARAEAKAGAGAGGAGAGAAAAAAYVDPMARFSGNWEKEFRPQWELEKSQLAMMGQQGQGQGQVGGASDPRSRSCKKCGGLGRVKCYNCDGSGKVLMGNAASQLFQCPICVGQLSCGCGSCRGTGISMKK
jgi:ferredoxin